MIFFYYIEIYIQIISASLGSLRQELSASHTVSVLVEYVDLLTERNASVHEQLVDAKKVLDDNNIAIERPEEAVLAVTVKTRSLSLAIVFLAHGE